MSRISPTCLNDTSGSAEPKRLVTSQVFKEHGAHCCVAPFKIFSVLSRKCCEIAGPVCRELMVGLGGLEPPASPLSGVRSNHLSYRPGFLRGRTKNGQALCGQHKSGGADRDRTDDPLLAKQVLSQLSYGPIWDGDPRRGVDRTLDCRCLVWAP